jgi:hypothetical protein
MAKVGLETHSTQGESRIILWVHMYYVSMYRYLCELTSITLRISCHYSTVISSQVLYLHGL